MQTAAPLTPFCHVRSHDNFCMFSQHYDSCSSVLEFHYAPAAVNTHKCIKLSLFISDWINETGRGWAQSQERTGSVLVSCTCRSSSRPSQLLCASMSRYAYVVGCYRCICCTHLQLFLCCEVVSFFMSPPHFSGIITKSIPCSGS